MTREAALHGLLAALFSPEELRTHLAHERDGGALAGALPEPGVAADQLVHAAVEALRRRGLIDREFFDNLEAARPRRREEIRAVRARWLDSARLDRGERWADGRYELVAPRGQGGIGLVWKAIDNQVGALVAVKILHELHADDRRVRQRFFRGARVLSELSHPAIVRVLSGVEQEGLRFFYVMEFIDGVGLDTLVGKLPAAELIAHLLQIGEALAHLHAKQLLHRDIKPNNILVTPQQQAKLIDFDLVTGDHFVAMTTRTLGTAIYAPPEATSNERKTPAYDVYSLARTVEFVLRGREPSGAELMAADPVATVPASEAVKDVLRAALRADPAGRTQSVKAFCLALRLTLKLAGDRPAGEGPTGDRPAPVASPGPASPGPPAGEPPAPEPAPEATPGSGAASFLGTLVVLVLVALVRHCLSK